MPSDKMGRFAFDGAEGIAFWVADGDERISVPIMFNELATLKQFLLYNLPGEFDPSKKRADRAEYALSRLADELDGLLDSMDEHVTTEDAYTGILRAWRTAVTPQRTHIKGQHDGEDVCLTCPKNSSGYRVAWDHLHSA